jgi:ferredoxin-NADP reductase/mono/diheme cytochrome c family protein
MLPSPLSALLGLLFILLGVAAVCLILEASRRTHGAKTRDRIIQAHRTAGYLFIALFCAMTWFMVLKVKDVPDELPLRSMLHILLAMVLAPLLLVKVIIARYYKSSGTILIPLGITIFTLGFVLIASAAGPYLLRRVTVKDISLDAIHMGEARIDMQGSEELMQKRCARCHNLDRVVGARKDARGWLATINRMRSLPGSGISEPDARVILSYLISENSINSSNVQGELAVGKALVDSHCNRCHGLDRTYQSTKTPAVWRATVLRMVNYARGTEGFFKAGEDERIIQYLAATQTREAAETRTVGSAEVTRGDRPLAQTPPVKRWSAASSLPTIGVTLLSAAVFGTLLWRRPKSPAQRIPAGRTQTAVVPTMKKSVILQLIRKDRQTHDCFSLRFRVTGTAPLAAKPGQFLTFDWLLDGEKLPRSYSIASSSTQTGFIEIAVKKQTGGRVSGYLNEQVPLGLTVEARGPFGQFCFDPEKHKSIVLFAGGSGITPMLSILRYIDDRCLETQVDLFYSVRTQEDIIFESELELLEARLPNFERIILSSRAANGEARHLTRELIAWQLNEINRHTFFLCGPEAFMEHVSGILLSLGVDPSRILQERFGGKRLIAETELETDAPVGTIEFVRSSRTGSFSAGRTLLEAAELNGVNIPYSCRQGQCGTCATRLVSGDVKMDCEDGLDADLKAQGYVLTCVARAQGDVRLDA